MTDDFKLDSKLDLVFERMTTVPPEKIWKSWTHPETLMKWFCPLPWKVTECRIDLKPGGEFFTVMQGPNGEKMNNHGCYLKVVENRELIWTGMMTKGFRPAPSDPMGFHFVATLLFTKTDNGTLYKGIVAHTDEDGRKKHEQMGFQEGWGKAFNQLESLMKS